MGWAIVADRGVPVGGRAVASVAAGRGPRTACLGFTAPTLFLATLAAEDVEQTHRQTSQKLRLYLSFTVDASSFRLYNYKHRQRRIQQVTYKLFNIKTKQTVSTGLTLQMASHYCKTNRDLIFLPS